MAAGGMAGACQIVITTPMELLKIQMQDAGRVKSAVKLSAWGLTKVCTTDSILNYKVGKLRQNNSQENKMHSRN